VKKFRQKHTSGVVGGAEDCNFLTDALNIRQKSDRSDYGCLKFKFLFEIFLEMGFQLQLLH